MNPDILLNNLLLGIESFKMVNDFPHTDRVLAEQALRDTLSQVSRIPLSGHESGFNNLAFSPDSQWLATASYDTTARLWDMNIEHLLEKACQVVGRNFTRAEWAMYSPGEDYRKTCEQWPLEAEVTSTP